MKFPQIFFLSKTYKEKQRAKNSQDTCGNEQGQMTFPDKYQDLLYFH